MGGLIKYFRFSWDQLLWEISYCNLMMLAATIPKHKSKAADSKPKDQHMGELDSEEKFNQFFKMK